MVSKEIMVVVVLFSIVLVFGCQGQAETADCALEGEMFSPVFTDEYPASCCEGLSEWMSGMDSRISVGDECYDTLMLKGSPTGICIDCGDGVCAEFETVCNCPQDCIGTTKTDYVSVEDFCMNNAGKDTPIEQMCIDYGSELDLCRLCAW